ncbi:MAG: hypothetical protein KAS62_05280, partial [Candidatus Delongbacteria bacterium]|nr:hypothetical protein [Candidatus Delongbacteria bacterium]
IEINSDCPNNEIIEFDLAISDGSNAKFQIIVSSLIFEFENVIVDGNGILEPNEESDISVSFKNIGSFDATSLDAELIALSEDVTVITSNSTVGNVSIDETATADFTIHAEEDCFVGISVPFQINITDADGLTTTIYFSLEVGDIEQDAPTGPDAYGYYAYDSEDTFYEQVPVYNWMNIDRFGTEIIMPDNLYDYTETVGLPFTFKYYGIDYNEIRISTDGWIAFGSGNQIAFENDSLPYVDDVNCMVAAFWDNLFDIWDENATLKYIYDNIEKYFVIQWSNVGHFENWGPEETFQIILLDPNYYPTDTGDGEIIFQYNTLSNIWNNTIGIENHNQDIGLQYVCNDNYLSTASILKDGLAIKFTTQIPSVNIDNLENEERIIPSKFTLKQNYPNPFNPNT